MKKVILSLNFVSLVFLFMLLSSISVPLKGGITGFATALSKPQFNFQPLFIVAFLVILTTTILNTYFLLVAKEEDSAPKKRKK